MISMMRIDDRLVHGQVAFVWSKHLGVNRIIVANDKVAVNDVQKMSLKMAVPDDIKCSVLSVDDAIDVLNDPRAEGLKILVIINNPTDARRISEKTKNISLVNVGNYGRITEDLNSKKKVAETFYVTNEDVSEFKEIIELGIKVEYQIVPSDKAKSVESMLKNI